MHEFSIILPKRISHPHKIRHSKEKSKHNSLKEPEHFLKRTKHTTKPKKWGPGGGSSDFSALKLLGSIPEPVMVF